MSLLTGLLTPQGHVALLGYLKEKKNRINDLKNGLEQDTVVKTDEWTSYQTPANHTLLVHRVAGVFQGDHSNHPDLG